MSNYRFFKKGNIKFPMTEEMLNYYLSLGFKCFVLKYYSRMDGFIYISPAMFWVKDGIIDCLDYDLFDREDIRRFLGGYNYDYFKIKYEQRCKEIFERQQY